MNGQQQRKEKRHSPLISRVLSGADVAEDKRRCIYIREVKAYAADAPLRTRPKGKSSFSELQIQPDPKVYI